MEPYSAAYTTRGTSSSRMARVTAVKVWLPLPWFTRPPPPCEPAVLRAVVPTASTWTFLSRNSLVSTSLPAAFSRARDTTRLTGSPGVTNPATCLVSSTPMESAWCFSGTGSRRRPETASEPTQRLSRSCSSSTMSTAANLFWIWGSETTPPLTAFFFGISTCAMSPVLLAFNPLVPAGIGLMATQTFTGSWSLMARRSAPLT